MRGDATCLMVKSALLCSEYPLMCILLHRYLGQMCDLHKVLAGIYGIAIAMVDPEGYLDTELSE